MHLIELRDDPALRAGGIMVRAGDKAFVSGAEINQFEKSATMPEASEQYSKKSAAQRAAAGDYRSLTIACIRGFCLGGGMQAAMLVDIASLPTRASRHSAAKTRDCLWL